MTRTLSLISIVALCAFGQSGISTAQSQSGAQQVIQALPLDGGKGSFRIAIRRDAVVHVDLQHDIRELTPTIEHPSVWVEHQFNRVRVRFDPKLSQDTVLDVPDIAVDITTLTEHVTIVFHNVEDPEPAIPEFFVTLPREQVEAERARQEKETEEKRKRDKLDGALARIDPIPRVVIPATGNARSNDGPVDAQLVHGRWEGPELFLYYDAHNTSSQSQPLPHPEVRDHRGQVLETDISGVEHYAVKDAENAGLVAIIPPGKRTRGVISLPRAADHQADGITLVFPGTKSTRPIELTVDEWATPWKISAGPSSGQPLALLPTTEPQQIMVPLSPAEIERERRDRDARGRLSVNAQALRGVAWLGSGFPDGLLEPTTLSGLGARMTYGINRLVWVEVDLLAANSGESRFDNMTINDVQGELVRTASFARMKAGGMLRLGYSVVPVLRAGLAMQVGDYDSQFFVDGTEVNGPESIVRFDGAYYFGGGLEFRFARSFVAGAAVSGLFSSDERFLEVGAHFGFTWNTRKDQ